MRKQRSSLPALGLCIDWETSGSAWGRDSTAEYQGISFGAIVFKTSNFSTVEELYLEIKFDEGRYKWSNEAESIHGLSRDRLEATGVSQTDAAAALAELILKYWGPHEKVMLLGHNTEFDRRFTNQLMNSIEIEFSVEKQTEFDSWIQLHHVLLDTSSAGCVAFGIYKSNDLFKHIGFEDREEHNALADAQMTLAAAQSIRLLVNEALGST